MPDTDETDPFAEIITRELTAEESAAIEAKYNLDLGETAEYEGLDGCYLQMEMEREI